jgi:ankyrin repeat protein
MTLLSVMLIMLAGCAPLLPGPVIEYKPLIRGDFSARTGPAKVSMESEDSLIKSGYVRIGNVRAVKTARCNQFYAAGSSLYACPGVSAETDAISAVLKKAAAKGGDIVVLTESNVSETHDLYSTGRCLREERRQVLVGNPSKWQDITICVESEKVKAGEYIVFRSAGTVWRHDPVHAKKMWIEKEYIAAVRKGDIRTVKECLAQGANPNSRATDQEGGPNGTVLSIAVQGGHAAVVKALLAAGADIGETSEFGKTVLMDAASEGQTDIVKELLARGADVNAKDKDGEPALVAAAFSGHAEIVKALLAHGADVNAKNKDGKTAGFSALMLSSGAAEVSADIVQALLIGGADVNAKDKYGRTALMFAVGKDNREIVEKLLAAGADVNAKDKDGQTALMLALYREPKLAYDERKKNAEVIELLKKAGAKE